MKISIRLLLIYFLFVHSSNAEFDPGKAGFNILVNNEIYPYEKFATYVLPEEHLGICINASYPENYEIIAEAGVLDFLDHCRWIWTAPAKRGLTSLLIKEKNNRDSMQLNVFLMTPANQMKNGRIEGIEIGSYPKTLDTSPLYQHPDGFIKVTAENQSTPVSPHFVLGQFVTPADNQFPKFIVLRERLLLKLEALVERLNDRDHEVESLSVIAGYMTPAYNKSIGGSLNSRHIYGGAAAIIIDTDEDGLMDDLDGNGMVDDLDGQLLFNIINALYSEPGKEYLRGGLFLHKKTPKRGPYVMLDARGYRKRWTNDSVTPTLPEHLKPKHKREFN